MGACESDQFWLMNGRHLAGRCLPADVDWIVWFPIEVHEKQANPGWVHPGCLFLVAPSKTSPRCRLLAASSSTPPPWCILCATSPMIHAFSPVFRVGSYLRTRPGNVKSESHYVRTILLTHRTPVAWTYEIVVLFRSQVEQRSPWSWKMKTNTDISYRWISYTMIAWRNAFFMGSSSCASLAWLLNWLVIS